MAHGPLVCCYCFREKEIRLRVIQILTPVPRLAEYIHFLVLLILVLGNYATIMPRSYVGNTVPHYLFKTFKRHC